MLYTDDWYFDKPQKTGRYLCILDYGNRCYDHEILGFFKEGEDAGAEYADKHNKNLKQSYSYLSFFPSFINLI